MLSSPGGAALAGIGIGEIIRQKGFVTFVPPNTYCASACAVAWLGGAQRVVSASGRIGFHGAFDMTTGQQSGPANALVGAYLNRLGLSSAAIVYVTRAGANAVQWLTAADATALGIDALVVACAGEQCSVTSTATNQTQQLPNPSASQGHEKRIAQSVERLFAEWSSTGADDSDDNARQITFLAKLKSVYSDTVAYYGRALPRDQVLADKAAFMLRWPQRDYRIRAGTLAVKCTAAGGGCLSCSVSGTVDYNVRAAGRSTGGAAAFAYGLAVPPSGDAAMIVSETSKVLERRSPGNWLDAPERRPRVMPP
jgi:hypothetical protein